jgi:hypothetical protein
LMAAPLFRPEATDQTCGAGNMICAPPEHVEESWHTFVPD